MKRHASRRMSGSMEGIKDMDAQSLVAIGAPLAAIGMLMLVPSVRRRVLSMSRGLIKRASRIDAGEMLRTAREAASTRMEGLKSASARTRH